MKIDDGLMRRPKQAQYLLRFDDLCPTMDRDRWLRFVAMIAKFQLQPILAVVPDNRDPELEVDPPDPGFWHEMRAMEQAGATIGLHGLQHVCAAEGGGLIPLHRWTEFAGVDADRQREWVVEGAATLRAHGLDARIWVAPRHGFDGVTICYLREAGIDLLSDGFARQPFRHLGMTWIPQQLWRPVEMVSGLWTICVHPNTATEQSMAELEEFLFRFGSQFTSVDRVLTEWPIEDRSLGDRWFQTQELLRMRLRKRRATKARLGELSLSA